MTKTLKAGEFKATCLKVMDEVAASGEAVVITKHGVPVAQLVPMTQKPKTLVGALKGRAVIVGDIVEALEVDWEAAL